MPSDRMAEAVEHLTIPPLAPLAALGAVLCLAEEAEEAAATITPPAGLEGTRHWEGLGETAAAGRRVEG